MKITFDFILLGSFIFLITFNCMQDLPTPNPELLTTLTTMEMPFGKYKGRLLYTLPVSYLEWFSQKGFPKSKLGLLLETLYEIKLNGLEEILYNLKKG